MTYDWESNYAVRGKISAGVQASQAGDAVLLGQNGKIPDAFISGSDFKYSLAFNATTFQTDPTACLAYADDAVGFTRVDGSAATALQSRITARGMIHRVRLRRGILYSARCSAAI